MVHRIFLAINLPKEIKKELGKRIKLDSVAEATLGRNKIGHGLEAVTWWKNGEVEKVKKYCLEDVRITKEIYDYARAHNILKYKNLGEIRDIKLDTSHWEKKENSSMTHTLPF